MILFYLFGDIQNSNGSHFALPVTLLPACVHSSTTNAVSTGNPFLSPSIVSSTSAMTTTFLPTVGEKLDIDVRMTEHASDSGQGDSDEDLRSQTLLQPPPVINLVRCMYILFSFIFYTRIHLHKYAIPILQCHGNLVKTIPGKGPLQERHSVVKITSISRSELFLTNIT